MELEQREQEAGGRRSRIKTVKMYTGEARETDLDGSGLLRYLSFTS